MRGEKYITHILSNVVIGFVICAVFAVSFVGYMGNAAVVGTLSPIYKGNADSGKVSLMVNVYWGTEYILPMLDIFDAHEVKTTFFVGGSWVGEHDETLQEIVKRGHEIGNHGYYHKDHDKISRQRNYEEIFYTHKLVEKITGVSMKLFAPPSGAFNKDTLSVAKELGYTTIMWSRDTIDWRDQDVNIITKRATNGISDGDLVLMHPTRCTLEALDNILTQIEEKSLKVCTVSEVVFDG